MPLNREAPLPARVLDHLSAVSRADLLGHQASVSAPWWQRRLSEHGFEMPSGTLGHDSDTVAISRGDLLSIGDGDLTPKRAMDLLWYTLGRGSGTDARRIDLRLTGLAAQADQLPMMLIAMWRAVREHVDPYDCFLTLLNEKGSGRIHSIGLAYASKLFYAAHGHQRPRNLILDSVVWCNLNEHGEWSGPEKLPWWAPTYRDYCALLGRWAEEAGDHLQRSVWPDEVEWSLFTAKWRAT